MTKITVKSFSEDGLFLSVRVTTVETPKLCKAVDVVCRRWCILIWKATIYRAIKRQLKITWLVGSLFSVQPAQPSWVDWRASQPSSSTFDSVNLLRRLYQHSPFIIVRVSIFSIIRLIESALWLTRISSPHIWGLNASLAMTQTLRLDKRTGQVDANRFR